MGNKVAVDDPHSDVDADTLEEIPTSVGVAVLLPGFSVGRPGGPTLVPALAGWSALQLADASVESGELTVMGLWLAFVGWRRPKPVDEFSARPANLSA
jgi:hypothetical protein